MEFLQYVNGPYAVIGLIVFVAAGALGVRSRTTSNARQKSLAPIFFGVAVLGLATTIVVAWLEMKKAEAPSQAAGTATNINAEGGSNVVNGVDSSGSGAVTINQGGPSQ
jgi:hypothetical protein